MPNGIQITTINLFDYYLYSKLGTMNNLMQNYKIILKTLQKNYSHSNVKDNAYVIFLSWPESKHSQSLLSMRIRGENLIFTLFYQQNNLSSTNYASEINLITLFYP